MTDSTTSGFLLPHDLSPERLQDQLGGQENCQLGDSAEFTLQFFDSFDWRLYGDDLCLLKMASPQGAALRLKTIEGDKVRELLDYRDTPAWPADLPAGELRDKVADLLDMRVLLPVTTVTGRATEIRILNDDQKTVVRMQYLHMECTSPDVDEPRSLWPRVRLLAVKGYEKDLEAMSRTFAEQHEWPVAPDCLFAEAVTAVGREPGDYSSKLSVALKPQQHAVDALRKILLTLLDTLERNVAGTRANLDSEFLHDLRVATRRTRSALSQVKRVLPDPVVDEFKERFAWLGQVTGPTRDLDVFLLELPDYQASLPQAMRGDLNLLNQRLQAQHVGAQRELVEALDSEQFHSLVRDWRATLEADAMPGDPGWFADLPIERVVSKRIWRMYRRVLKDGRAAVKHGEAEAMHELRKDCKKLRYLIEFFRSLYAPGELKGIVKALKALLDNLGEFQDKEVQALHLRELAAEFDLADPEALPAVMAIGALAADSLRAQQAAHERFAACFANFDSPRNRKRYRTLFKPDGGNAR